MSRIRSKNTRIDLAMNEMLRGLGCEYEMYPDMHGRPDFAIWSLEIAIFCDGDFWHGYRYREKNVPAGYWQNKIERNMRRDASVSRRLRMDGWSVLRFWEHDINRNPEKCIRKIQRKIGERRQK